MAEVLRHIHGVYRRTEDHDYAKLFKMVWSLPFQTLDNIGEEEIIHSDWLRGSKCSGLSEQSLA